MPAPHIPDPPRVWLLRQILWAVYLPTVILAVFNLLAVGRLHLVNATANALVVLCWALFVAAWFEKARFAAKVDRDRQLEREQRLNKLRRTPPPSDGDQ